MTRQICPFVFAASLALGVSVFPCRGAGLKVDGLKCEYRVNPLGLDTPSAAPELAAGIPGARPAADGLPGARGDQSRTLLAKGKGDLWDSGKVPSGESVHVVYGGKPLHSGPAGLLESARVGPRRAGPRLTARRRGGRWGCWRRRIGARPGSRASGPSRSRSSRCSRTTRRRCSARSSDREEDQPRTGLCQRPGLLRAAPERAARRRPGAGPRLDHLLEARALLHLRCDGPVEAGHQRARGDARQRVVQSPALAPVGPHQSAREPDRRRAARHPAACGRVHRRHVADDCHRRKLEGRRRPHPAEQRLSGRSL